MKVNYNYSLLNYEHETIHVAIDLQYMYTFRFVNLLTLRGSLITFTQSTDINSNQTRWFVLLALSLDQSVSSLPRCEASSQRFLDSNRLLTDW